MASLVVPHHEKWKLHLLRRAVFEHGHLPVDGSDQDVDTWNLLITTTQVHIRKRRDQLQRETRDHEKTKLTEALNRVRGDFGHRKRTFKAALLQNQPRIPLWGVQSSHPDTIHLDLAWEPSAIQTVLPSALALKNGVTRASDGGLFLTCDDHADRRLVIDALPAGTRTVLRAKARLVADPANKLCGVENFYGTNALGALPRCALHMACTPDLACLSVVDGDGSRSLRWHCNQCKGHCQIESPQLQTAKSFLPAEVFNGFNSIPGSYDTHLRHKVTLDDLQHVIRCLPLRKAPGPDAIPNEVL